MSEEGTRPSKTFRIFVSSTFSDLKAERDALQRYVFPRLRELCAKSGARFQAIDLRWGVSEEAGLDQRTMPICQGEIERCQKVTPRPNFVVLLGDRYGWRPLPPEIPAAEFAAIEAKVTAADDKALLKTWYRLDENAAPPVWCLQPRKVDIAESATPEVRKAATEREKAQWADVEARLRAILCGAVAAAGYDEKARVRYEASATEQEILRGALQVPDAAGHVFGFFRALEGEPTEASGRDFFDGAVSDGRFVVDGESHDRQTALKEKSLRPLLGREDEKGQWKSNVHDYRASLTSDGITTDHIGSLPDDYEACLALLDDPKATGTLCPDVWRSLGRLNTLDYLIGQAPKGSGRPVTY